MRQLEIKDLNNLNNFKLSDLAAEIEAVLFMSPEGASEKLLLEVLGVSEAELKRALNELDWTLKNLNHGIKLKFIANSWVLETEPNFYEVLERLQEVREGQGKRRMQLRRAAVEVLAIIAYNQPVTRAEIEDLRGTRCEGILSRLLNYGLIKISGRKGKAESQKENAKRGALVYKTTERFLELFGLENINSLPSLDEIEEELIDFEQDNASGLDDEELEQEPENNNDEQGGDE
ncbi:MAG: SMC-Scp complex subunit ScpB [Synergistaceae bacterium]|nr:SMC-Scp complex subunit ScpB [Synergistaceae bacterium]MBQ3625758.1 SMC-Scp complex subunit ScpB [Synergistaceae bacterium]MBQ7570257.1 SMC-Scp complex subunit ScpB [Synergistaceae bacterium]MBQ9581656.1 SMC-Scp complex subunit ScpB [Synergistaceae bacterium]MBQ9896741.1 SMC-Scp complex subunit ScpB [Synergistaceae bacterium]